MNRIKPKNSNNNKKQIKTLFSSVGECLVILIGPSMKLRERRSDIRIIFKLVRLICRPSIVYFVYYRILINKTSFTVVLMTNIHVHKPV